ncbi:neuropeptide-like protein 31 [Macrobrachium nipponense]|uniref:neuropeptide-like protein 31 n=1 Tax=Macrobrachium nipponense TaxID=159736 RepID=UPI0030C8A0E4
MNFLRPVFVVAIVMAVVCSTLAMPGGLGYGLGGFGGGLGGFGGGLGYGGVTVVRPVVSRVVTVGGFGGLGGLGGFGGRYGGYGW